MLRSWEDVACLGSQLRRNRSSLLVKRLPGPTRPQQWTALGRVSCAWGSTVLLRTAQAVGLTTALTEALAPWRKQMARYYPGKTAADLAVSLAVGGDCLAEVAQLRVAPKVFGLVASDPTVSRLIDTLAADAPPRSQQPCSRPRGRRGPTEGDGPGRHPGRRSFGGLNSTGRTVGEVKLAPPMRLRQRRCPPVRRRALRG
ncbi:transposase [Geodermatophilus sp. URMC 62]|uniref:transposase n=1 Tax=Geodermatophilus sp. URMC 62 TaxID=3423414 RepID=UPI00406C37AF